MKHISSRSSTYALLFATIFSAGKNDARFDGRFDKFYKFNREKLTRRVSASSLCRSNLHQSPTTTITTTTTAAFRFPRRDPSLIARFLAFFSEARERSRRAPRAALADGMRARRVPASPRRSTLGALRAVCYGYIRVLARETHSVGLSGAHTAPRRERERDSSAPAPFLGSIFESFHEIKIGFGDSSRRDED